MITPLTFPTLVKRLVKGAEVTFAEGDKNLDDIRTFCLALQDLLVSILETSLKDDGTLLANSVSAESIQAAAVSLQSLHPSLLYSIIPVDNDTGDQNAFAITARGGAGGANLVPGGAVYDAEGNYTLNGLTLNYGFLWTKGANDTSCQSDAPAALVATGVFIADSTSVVLVGTAGAAVTATVSQTAPVAAYKNGQIFFVYTNTSNTGPATLNVNGLGAIPIKFQGNQLINGSIVAPCVFAVVYQAGIFILFSGGSSTSGITSAGGAVITTTGFSGNVTFNMPTKALAVAYPTTNQVAHGLGGAPTQFNPSLLCTAADVGFTAGQSVPLDAFKDNAGANLAYDWYFDGQYFYITENAAPYVINPATGALVALTVGSWVIQASASINTSFAGVSVFPALQYELANPEGAFSYGTSLYAFSRSSYSNGGKCYVNQINLLNNAVTPLSQSASQWQHVNGAIFGTGFFASPTFVFGSDAGYWTFSAVNPGTNLITGGTAYDATGAATVAIPGAGTYIWTPGANDISLTVGATTYLASNAVNGRISVVAAGAATGNMVGAPSTVVTATLFTTTAAWAPALFSTKLTGGTFKPCWYAAGGTPTVYAVSSNPSAVFSGSGAKISRIGCYQITAAAAVVNTWAANNNAALDLTSANVVNVATFNTWYPVGSTAPLMLFQYNPLTKRVYVMTQELAMIHIFQLTTATNDFQAWWNTASPTREQKISYIKSLAFAGMGTIISSLQQCNYTVEYDQNTGKEICLVFTRDGSGSQNGSVTRIPWVE